MSGPAAWFAGRSIREKRLLTVMGVLLVVTVVWGLILRPVSDAMAGARMRHTDAVIRLGDTATRVDALRQARERRAAPLVGTLADTIRIRAEEAGFPLASVDPDPAGGVRIAIQSARGAALTGWLARLERSGIIVESVQMTDNGDRTVAARLLLRSRGA